MKASRIEYVVMLVVVIIWNHSCRVFTIWTELGSRGARSIATYVGFKLMNLITYLSVGAHFGIVGKVVKVGVFRFSGKGAGAKNCGRSI